MYSQSFGTSSMVPLSTDSLTNSCRLQQTRSSAKSGYNSEQRIRLRVEHGRLRVRSHSAKKLPKIAPRLVFAFDAMTECVDDETFQVSLVFLQNSLSLLKRSNSVRRKEILQLNGVDQYSKVLICGEFLDHRGRLFATLLRFLLQLGLVLILQIFQFRRRRPSVRN